MLSARGASKDLFNEGNKLELTEEGYRQTVGQGDTDQLEPGRIGWGWGERGSCHCNISKDISIAAGPTNKTPS